jgi:parallel beta-helix repeat protein
MRILICSIGLALLAAAGVSHAQNNAPTSDHRPDIVVDDDKVQCPTAQFSSIQDAINAANPGSVIRVCAGTYREQLSIHKSLRIAADNGAILLPGVLTANAMGSSGGAVAAAILVRDAANVDISGLIVDTTNNGIASCATDLIGIFFQNSSGSIAHNAVRNTKLIPALNGCQSGNAIVVQSLGGETSKVQISENSVHDYQKNGITGNEAGTQVVITGNVVIGLGATNGAAQNGIQIGFGGAGRIAHNTVTGNVFAPCVSPTECVANATGILVFESDEVRVVANTVSGNQVGIFAGGNHGIVTDNSVSSSMILAGVDLGGDNNVASNNEITESGQAAVSIEGNDNSVLGNQFTEAPVGILTLADAIGNIRSGNSYFAILIKIEGPSTHRMARPGAKR